MPFFGIINNQENSISSKNKPSLRDIKPDRFYRVAISNLSIFLKKRVSFFISHEIKGSITLESSLVLPFFLFAMLSLISVMDIMRIKGCMDVAVAEIGNEIAIESYGEYIDDMFMTLQIKSKLCTFLKENLSEKDFNKVSESITVTELTHIQDKNIMSFKVNYKLRPDSTMPGITAVKLTAGYYGHKWLGYEGGGTTEPMVFLSKEASVYHLSKECKYLNVTILEISYSNLEKYRNNSRKKYKACHFCNNESNLKKIYITPEGDNYHTVKNCIGLKRFIYTVPLSTVKDKRICTGCQE